MSGEWTLRDRPLRERAAAAVGDDRLRGSLARATDRFATGRRTGLAALEDPDGLRRAARAVRADVLADLPGVLEAFADRVVALGGHVCWATTAAEANRYVLDVADRAGARTVVKSKSMATEELALNEHLEAAGRRVVETDLGEWIVQLAHETPSHIIAPAVHRDRHQIAEVLGRVRGGESLEVVPEAMAAFARARLRDEFLRADLGISGCNLAVADTGSVVLVTNEGNGRMATSLPRVHVAVMGMERIVRDWDQAELVLALLARSATGQPLTSYTNVITGPRRPGEADGPDELHVVILDNGRSGMLGSDDHEMLACIRCGACLNVCPVYRQIGGHAYGWVYSGPMGAVLTPLLAAEEGAHDGCVDHRALEVAGASTLCAACMDACPVAIPLQDLLLGLRRRKAAHAALPERAAWRAWAAAWSDPGRYRASLRAAGYGGGLAGLAGHLPGLQRWAGGRDAPRPARRTFRDRWDAGDV